MLLAGAGCDNTVIVPGDGGAGGAGGEGIGLIDIPNGGGGGVDGGTDALNEFVDPGCKDIPPPIEDFQCDPTDQGNGDCLFGEGCYIYVDYPDDPCGQEIYGAFCMTEGFGQQGDPCGGGQDCGAGLVCVVTGSGTQCVVMCDLDGPSGCPSGLVCEAIDVEGFGGCL
ncbi:MAG: hypothetical protein IPM79_21295 [Polyangiaceae bacterium]|nr:hypothetical protein [Polyangiaceae bacterium]MBK8940083.1 hypothetical protein [Polyangiaceae bacterium]